VRDYWEHRLAEHESLSGVGWIGLGESFNRWMYRVRARVFSAAVRREADTAPADMKVLDIGSGTGFYLDLWRRLGAGAITGSDFTNVVVERLRARRPGTEIRQLDIGADALPRGATGYDAISAMDVLFHIVDDDAYRRAFANLSGLLRPGGLLLFSENLLQHPAARASHQVSRSEPAIAEIIEESGLARVDVRPMFVLMNTPLDSSSRALRSWWRLLTRVVSAHDTVGFTLGAALYPIELTLVRSLRRGPSTKLLVCRKR
jgi:SAM-dependent methyltransferase